MLSTFLFRFSSSNEPFPFSELDLVVLRGRGNKSESTCLHQSQCFGPMAARVFQHRVALGGYTSMPPEGTNKGVMGEDCILTEFWERGLYWSQEFSAIPRIEQNCNGFLNRKKRLPDQLFKAITPAGKQAIAESTGNEGGITLIQIYSSALLITLDSPQTNSLAHAKSSFTNPGSSGE